MQNYDALIDISLLPSGIKEGRKGPIISGYHGNYLIKENYLTSGQIQLIHQDELSPGESCEAFIKFITPEEYPGSLWFGKRINIQEGSRKIGIATIKEIYNELLYSAYEHSESPLEKWYNGLKQKNINEYSIEDMCKCLRQDVNILQILPHAINTVINDKNTGDLYDGEMFFALIGIKEKYWDKQNFVAVKNVAKEFAEQADVAETIKINDWIKSMKKKFQET